MDKINWKGLLRGATVAMFLLSSNVMLITLAMNGETWAQAALTAIGVACLAWLGIEIKQAK